MKTINRCMSPTNGRHMEPICFQALCSFQGRKFWKWSWLKSFGILCSYLSTKGTLQRQLWKERSGFKLLNFLNQEIEELGQKSVVNSYKPEFRVIKFQRCSICPSIHCEHQIIWNPANFVTSYIVVKYSCIAQIVVHLFWPMKCTFLFEFLNLAQLCCCRTLRY